MAKKTINIDVELNTNKAEKEVTKFSNFLKVEDNLIINYYKRSEKVITNIGHVAEASAEVSARVEALDKLNLKAFGTVDKLNEARMQGLVAEIAEEAKKGKAIEATNELYRKKEQLIIEQSETAKKRVEKEYAVLIEAAKIAGTDITAYDAIKAENIAGIDKKLKEDLKKNNQENFAAQKAFMEKGLKETTELLTKNVYHGGEILDKDSKQKIERLDKEKTAQADLIKKWYDDEMKNSEANMKSEADIQAEKAARTEALEFLHNAKVAKIKEDAAKKTQATTAEVAKDTAAKADETAKKVEETAKKTEEAGKKAENSFKGIFNVGEMSRNIGEGIKELKHYDDQLTISMMNEASRFEQAKKNYEGDEVALKELLDAKNETLAMYAAEKIRIEELITAAEQKQQGLRLEQMKQYATKAQQVANEIKGGMTKVADYFGTALGAVSNIYKAEIASIDEDIAHAKAKNAEFTQNQANSEAEKKAIAAAKVEREKELSKDLGRAVTDADKEKDAQYQKLLKREEDTQEELDKGFAKKQEIEAKERELLAKKAKKQAEQEKIEKLNRKATLVKNIGESIANVAQGVTKALSYGPILGPILATVVALAGAVQVGIMTKQLAKFKDGGLLRGKRHTQGGMRIEGTNIEVEGGEYVVNRESTSKNLGLVRYINSQRKELTSTDVNSFFSKASQGYEPPFRRMFESGGQVPAIDKSSTIDNDALIDAIKSIKIAPRVAVTDIIRAQDEAVQVDGWTGV